MTQEQTVDYKAITARQQTTWASGDFNVVALQVMSASDALVQAVDVRPNQRVLDIACGSGNAALVAARRYARVTGVDYVPALVERAKQRAAAEGTSIEFHTGDAQALAYDDASFDAVLSVFGVMFAPDQEKSAREIIRVTRSGARIGLACWMPEEFGGDLFRAHSKHVPPPAGLKPPVRWGTEAGLRELFGADAASVRIERRTLFQYFRSAEHAFEVFRTYFGPTYKALEILPPERHAEFQSDVTSVFQRYNRASDGTASIECQYLQAIVTRA